MMEVEGENILIEILNKFEIWEQTLDLAMNIFLSLRQESAGCWHLLLCHRHNTELLLEQHTGAVYNQLEKSTWVWLLGTAEQPPSWKPAPQNLPLTGPLMKGPLKTQTNCKSPQVFAKKQTNKRTVDKYSGCSPTFSTKKSKGLSFVQRGSI